MYEKAIKISIKFLGKWCLLNETLKNVIIITKDTWAVKSITVTFSSLHTKINHTRG